MVAEALPSYIWLGRYVPQQASLLNFLRTIEGRIASVSECVEAVWPQGRREPEYPEDVVRTLVMLLRFRGFPIRTEFSRGFYFQPVNNPLIDAVVKAA